MQISDITPFFVPVVGAVTAFFLSRGSALRRSRTAALEDLQVSEKATSLFEKGDPLADQIMAHARTSLLRYHGARVATDQRASRIAGRLLLAAVILAS